MPVISFAKNRSPIECLEGINLMQMLQSQQIPVASSCLGDGICGKCKVQVLSGAENLSPIADREQFLKTRLKMAANERVSCQCSVHGDICIDTSYW